MNISCKRLEIFVQFYFFFFFYKMYVSLNPPVLPGYQVLVELCPILSLRSTQVTIVRSTRETGDIHYASVRIKMHSDTYCNIAHMPTLAYLCKYTFHFLLMPIQRQGTVALWSNSSCIRSGDPRSESRRGYPEFFILLNRREDARARRNKQHRMDVQKEQAQLEERENLH